MSSQPAVGRFRHRLDEGPPVLLDGATGTELARRGVDTGLPLWSARALLEAPEMLAGIHEEYVAAGAEVVTTNTFRTHRRTLERAGIGDRAEGLTRLAVEIARGAAAKSTDRCFVAGSISPLEDCYSPSLVPPDDELEAEHRAMAGQLVAAGVDFLLIETMNTIREAVAATRAAAATGLATVVGLVCDRSTELLSGETLDSALEALAALRPDAVVVNCTPTPAVRDCLELIAQYSDLPTGAYGNVGYADPERGWVNTDSIDPRAYARHAGGWLDLGVRLVGGCCGTTPEHIRALRELIDSR